VRLRLLAPWAFALLACASAPLAAAAEPLEALQDAPQPVGRHLQHPLGVLRAPEPPPAAVVVGGTAWLASPLAGARRRGPVEIRDEWLLAQPRLTLPAVSPDPVGRGRWQARVAVNRGNDFGWAQTSAGELPAAGDRRFLVDGEHQTTEASLRYGLTSTLDLAVRVPIHWRGGGFMDGAIDFFHDAFAWAGFLDNDRPSFRNDKFRVEGRSPSGVPFSWTDDEGAGLGNVELAAHWAFLGARPGAPWTVAAVGRVTLPTATGVYEVGGVDVGVQLVAARRLGRAFDLYMGVGGTFFGEPEIDGLTYEEVRGAGFVALEWRPASTWSLLVQVDGSTNLVKDVASYPEIQSYVHVAAKFDLSRCWQLEIGFTENLHDQQSTIDFGAFAGLVGRF
jgi:hypothetical protein